MKEIYSPCLKILDLNNNKIKDISVLSQVNFKELKVLYLKGNIIQDIEILKQYTDYMELNKLKLEFLEIKDFDKLLIIS